MPRRSLFLRILAAFAIALVGILYISLVVSAFHNGGKPLTTLTPAGVNSQTIQNLVLPVFAVAGVVFLIVFGAVFFASWRFRERAEDPTLPHQLHGNTKYEIGWTILPALILAVIAVFTVITIIDLEKRSDDALKVKVEGQQWWWSFHYDVNGDGSYDGPGDVLTATELVIPAGREVDLVITSNDVIHSFWIPGLNGKKDAVPGMDTYWKIEADKPGIYRGQCTEYCGLSHANMRMLVRALPQADYDRWLANQEKNPAPPADGTLAAQGQQVFSSLCAQCHVVNGQFEKAADPATPPPLTSGVAPNLTHLMTRGTFAGSIFNLWSPDLPTDADPTGNAGDVALAGNPGDTLYGGDSAYYFNRPTLEAWLRDPPAVKPNYAQGGRGMPNLGLTEQQIDQLIAYLQTLK